MVPKNKTTQNTTTATDVDAYLAALPESTRTALQGLRDAIRAAADARENIGP